jgi:HlyD family secretion protein
VLAIVAATVLLTAAGGTFALIGKHNSDSKAASAHNPVLTVTVAAAQYKNIEDTVSVTGSVSAWDPLSIGSEISGLRIQSVEVEEGDTVKKGQVLARLNSALLEAQLNQAKARLLSSEATLKKSIQPNRPEQISALQSALQEAQANTAQEEAHHKQAKVNLSNAVLNAKRYAQLAHVGGVSFEDSENKQVAAEAAQDEVLSSEAKLRALKSLEEQARQHMVEAQRGGRSEDIDVSRATLDEMRGQVQQLEEQIRQTVILAPDDGLISKRDAHIGNIASSGTTLFSMIRMNRLELRAAANDIDLPKFHVGQNVDISTTEDGQTHIAGKVTLVSPQVDATTRLGVVRVELPKDSGLKPGMFVRGEVQLGQRSALTVPVDALVTRNGQSLVYILDGDRAINRPVKTGYQSETFVEISEGLTPNQTVIVKGARFLSDRDIVRVGQ